MLYCFHWSSSIDALMRPDSSLWIMYGWYYVNVCKECVPVFLLLNEFPKYRRILKFILDMHGDILNLFFLECTGIFECMHGMYNILNPRFIWYSLKQLPMNVREYYDILSGMFGFKVRTIPSEFLWQVQKKRKRKRKQCI